MRSPHLYTPSRIAAAAVIGLNDEPVGYWPNVARLKSGLRASAEKRAMLIAAPFANAFRSKVGRLAIVRISLLHGSCATGAPLPSASAFAAARRDRSGSSGRAFPAPRHLR